MTEQLSFDLTTKHSRDRVAIAVVLEQIRRHAGRENPITMHTIAAVAHVSARDVQAIVKFLVEERSYPIGTATSRPFGYYMIRTPDELRRNYAHFVRRGVSNLKHANAFKKGSIVGPIVGQLELEIDEQR